MIQERMEYIDVQWLHNDEVDPERLVSELNDARFETRKLEFYSDGRGGFADASREVRGTRLRTEPIPAMSEINSDPQFVGELISATQFEDLWHEHSH